MKFLLASETVQRHVPEIVERDTWEIDRLIWTEGEVQKGVFEVVALAGYTTYRFAFAGALSDNWTIFNGSVFIVRFPFSWLKCQIISSQTHRTN